MENGWIGCFPKSLNLNIISLQQPEINVSPAYLVSFSLSSPLASNGGVCREEKSQLGFALLNFSYSTKQTSHYSDCKYVSALDPQCMSFNFWWEKKICDLNSKAREHSCRACFVTDKSSTYMGMARYPGYPGNKKCLKIADYKIMYATPSQIIAFPCLSVNSQMID